MIEDRLRDAYARKEAEVPMASALIARINTTARRRRRGRWVIRSAASALAVVLIAVAAPMLARAWAPALPLSLPLPGASGPSVPDGQLNFLLLGLDRWPSQKATELTRSDTILIVHVPADRSGVQLISIPRDMLVERAEVPGRAGSTGPYKMSELYAVSGLPLVEKQVAKLAGVTFQGTLVVEFAGLTALIDEVGGVYFCLDQETRSIHTGRTYPVGCRRFSGAEMRDVLRQRQYEHGALDRDRHNAQFLASLVKQLIGAGTLLDVAKLRAAYVTLSRDAAIDTRGLNAVELAWQLRGALGSISYAGMQVRTSYIHGKAYVTPGTNAAALFAALRDDTVPAWITAHEHDQLFEGQS